jgi:hypothetical protein
MVLYAPRRKKKYTQTGLFHPSALKKGRTRKMECLGRK